MRCIYGISVRSVLLLYSVSNLLEFIALSRSTTIDGDWKCSQNAWPKFTKQELLDYLKKISGSNVISGTHNNWVTDFDKGPQLMQNITGVYPGLWSAELSLGIDDVLNRQLIIDEALSQWKSGSLVSLKLCFCPPTLYETCTAREIIQKLNKSDWEQLITDGSNLNKLWKIRLNSIAPYLKQLEFSGVITIFDPMPGINYKGNWWSGNLGVDGSRKLYQITHDHFTEYHGLKSIIWTWSIIHGEDSNTVTTLREYWPGTQFVDVSSIYLRDKKEPTVVDYQKLIAISGDKLLSLEMMYTAPTDELLNACPKWSWFTVSHLALKNSSWNDDDFKMKCKNPKIIHQGDIGVFMSKNHALNQTAVASTQFSKDYSAGFAVDGDNKTIWGTPRTSGDNEWIYIDLGKLKYIRKVKLFWDDYFGKGYQIQTSEDFVSWKVVHQELIGDGGEDSITFSPTFAKYVKMFGLKASGWRYGLYEFEVY